MSGYMALIPGSVQKPLTCCKRIGHGFLGGERFGSNHKHRGFRIELLEGFRNMSAVNI